MATLCIVNPASSLVGASKPNACPPKKSNADKKIDILCKYFDLLKDYGIHLHYSHYPKIVDKTCLQSETNKPLEIRQPNRFHFPTLFYPNKSIEVDAYKACVTLQIRTEKNKRSYCEVGFVERAPDSTKTKIATFSIPLTKEEEEELMEDASA